ncbi:MAG: hypothetical protein DMF78_25830 [Acidobacteria bacterium]|nr:MAG: hypothetical protein DMF78_25830 [Acidobacteriota bacterium]
MSARKASISAGEGGRPVRSRVTRRRIVSRVASGDGARPSASRRASTNASMGVLTQSPRFTAGTSGRTGFT